MNKLTFIIEDCFKQNMNQRKKALAGGYAIPNLTKEAFIAACVDLVCARAAAGVRYQGKDKIKELLLDYGAKKQQAFLDTLK